MPARIEVSSSASGPSNFTLTTNPTFYDPQDSVHGSKFETIGGAPIRQIGTWDGRERTMTWRSNDVDDANVSSIVTYFRSVKGAIRYLNFKDMDDMNLGWPTTDTWKKSRIIDFTAKYRSGGKIKYDSFSIIIQPEQ